MNEQRARAIEERHLGRIRRDRLDFSVRRDADGLALPVGRELLLEEVPQGVLRRPHDEGVDVAGIVAGHRDARRCGVDRRRRIRVSGIALRTRLPVIEPVVAVHGEDFDPALVIPRAGDLAEGHAVTELDPGKARVARGEVIGVAVVEDAEDLRAAAAAIERRGHAERAVRLDDGDVLDLAGGHAIGDERTVQRAERGLGRIAAEPERIVRLDVQRRAVEPRRIGAPDRIGERVDHPDRAVELREHSDVERSSDLLGDHRDDSGGLKGLGNGHLLRRRPSRCVRGPRHVLQRQTARREDDDRSVGVDAGGDVLSA